MPNHLIDFVLSIKLIIMSALQKPHTSQKHSIKRKFNLGNTSFRERNNESLPSIKNFAADSKVNIIREHITQARNQIMLVKARLNALKSTKAKNQKQRQRSLTQIKYAQTIKQRLQEQKKLKQQVASQRNKEMEYLKMQATIRREKMLQQKSKSKNLLLQHKQLQAEEKRSLSREASEYIYKNRSTQLEENRLKVKSVKLAEIEGSERLKQFNQSRIVFARENHHSRVEKSIQQKQKALRQLKKLKKQQKRMIEDCKQSEASLLTSLYELQGLNPQKSKRGALSNRSSSQIF